VASAIRAVAMAKGAERTRRLEENLRELREQLEARQVAGLDLDRYLEEVVVTPEREEPPVRLKDAEALLIGSKIHAKGFRPHPEIGGAYLLSWEGEDIGVTFDPNLFDRFPESLRLLSFGDETLTRLLEAVADPAIAHETGRILRCAAIGDHEQRGYFVVREGHVAEIPTLAALRKALGESSPVSDFETVRRETLERFTSNVRETRRRDHDIEESRRRSARLTLEEQGRQLLLKAALLDIAIARQQELWDEPSSADFSEDVVRNLRRKGFPFAPLLTLVSIEGLRPTPTDPYFVRIQGETRESLERRVAPLKGQIMELVKRLARSNQEQRDAVQAVEVPADAVSVTTYR
jgi:hypothetical protein